MALVLVVGVQHPALMGKPRLEPLTEVNFLCEDCGAEFIRAPATVEDDPDRPWHPFYYTAPCPQCPNGIVEQDPRHRGLLKAWANATGPRTPEGKTKSAQNLEGHPTPEEAKITRLNAIKHGAFATVANYFPARPGKYASCDICEYYGDVCIEDPPRHHKNPIGCYKKAELMVQYQIAVDSGDIEMIKGLLANNQASIQAIINEMILQMSMDGGPRIKEKAWYHDKDGGFHLAGYKDDDGNFVQLYKLEAHPMAKLLMEYITKNDLTLGDMGMTPKVQQEQDLIAGHLANEKREQQEEDDFRQKQIEDMESLKQMIANSGKRLARDPILIEHGQNTDDG